MKKKTIFDKPNTEVVTAFQLILEDVYSIINDEEFPQMLIMGVDENAPKAELGKAYVRQKGGEKIYKWLKVFLAKKPQHIYNILDVLFCVEKGTYSKKSFKQTLKDLITFRSEFIAFINFSRAVGLLK